MADQGARAALITGGSAGIGRAIAEMLAGEGYGLTLMARKPDRLRECVTALESGGASVLGVAGNAALEEDLDRAVAEHRDRFGRLDVLVNNAGVGLHGSIEETSVKHLDLQLAVNLRAAQILMSKTAPLLRKAGAEHGKALVVNVSSMFGRYPQAGTAAYSTTKAALVALSAAAHGELSTSGVQVTALCPGATDTPGFAWAADRKGDVMMPSSDVAEAVRFLLRTSGRCFVPEIALAVAGGDLHNMGA
ncbi:SDR family NAD(P)-dependent oxidoreductase [Actinomadura montaniterrae]|uniref:SDR family oxidoreductase n=1 Tax=Actinomadura montaniterrae TaxID=1803903 RepID=A0A6L3W643_9ACTN|nr:SDR family oxidoreductase [Actinomadura montaniterrae]KAB2384831.1 SDR family oxidoreductase [Actinomadura montaniterrae]